MVYTDKIIEWSDELSVGIQEIDEQHKVLVNILNELNAAIKTGRSFDIRVKLLDKIIEYTKTHFIVEESLMRILGYPKYEEHKQQHEILMVQVLEHRVKMTSLEGSSLSSYDLLFFLRHWLSEHIMKSDKEYEPYFIQMGVKKSWTKNSWLKKFWS
ncbi:MAG: hemerythrin [Gammaproteobacteria bacterium]|nr:MAG: hemerythrin [Gammaproteobacteria bacterium]RKZ40224.1 MAG: hemerythrin [Gammaproteobacteria bacterium]RKZ73599.1 MAG: hemerythrin [Gammaproteobacteria bacterium]